ncbi:MAG: sensor histidine kinase, partial [Clostridia bacterium]|nr:sensor histidine kinase [Clostridia bacterium]
MKELSLNILDIVQNSLTAGASHIEIDLAETDETLRITVTDDGCGMDENTVRNVTDPFYTTRKTRSVGLGIPFFKLAAEQTGG